MTDMSMLRAFPSRNALIRPRQSVIDVAVFFGIAVLLWIIIRTSSGFSVPFNPSNAPSTVSTDVSALPYYAARSLLRMFIALALSVLFTFVYATAAARLRRAQKVLLPILDILQSVPILGFLSVTITAFIALFPGSELGLECASIFAIFTSQAWNMTFAFYHSLVAQPRDLDEASRLLRLTRWQRFWRMDVPSGMIPLVWNGMMSFGGGWFFLVASEALSVDNHTYVLPGIGAYVYTANQQGQWNKILIAIAVMVIMVIGVNVLFWRPLTAWAERFRFEDSEAAEKPRSVVLNLLRRSRLPKLLGRVLGWTVAPMDLVMGKFGLADYPLLFSRARRRVIDVVFAVVVLAAVAFGLFEALSYVHSTVGLGEFPHALLLGLFTFGRVLLLLAVATAIWVPIGVWIGLNPKVSRLAQPIVQVLASFPAQFLFPIAVAVFVATGISLNWGGILLMALGAQWYILFNVIAGASAIPNDLREASASLHLTRTLWWRRLIIPGIFPSYVTGAITAAGGAWNASIVAEVVTYHTHQLTASGLGAYIAAAAGAGDFPRLLVGVSVMSLYVVGLNRTFWRRLYDIAQQRFSY
jgi:NitT/TauT family transport system permease protein